MKSINQHLFTGYTEVHPGVYIAHRDFFWTFMSAGRSLEEGICDWWYDVAAEYPSDTIIFQPVDTSEEMIEINKDTIYRGAWQLDDQPEVLCYYKVLDTSRLKV